MRTIAYLENNVKNSILNDVRDIAQYHSRRDRVKSAGFFSVPRLVFCYIDYLGYVAYGKEQHTVYAIKFIKNFFPKNYKGYAELLYSMWRHGTVHQYEPKSFYASFRGRSMNLSVTWLSNNSNLRANRKENLKFYSRQDSNRCVLLVINSCQLVDDLLFALDRFIAVLKKDQGYKAECEESWMIVERY